MGACSILALCHDALIVLGAYAVLRIPMGNSFIAAILTVLGYSINATIVIFDRIRENRSRVGRNNYEELVNVSVKQTLTRSLFTSLTTFFTVACLYVLGVDSVKEFVLPIAVGIVCGTFSSVCIAGNLWYVVSAYREKRKAAGRAAKIAAAKANK
jgi:SecD/SecF fusion protein